MPMLSVGELQESISSRGLYLSLSHAEVLASLGDLGVESRRLLLHELRQLSHVQRPVDVVVAALALRIHVKPVAHQGLHLMRMTSPTSSTCHIPCTLFELQCRL